MAVTEITKRPLFPGQYLWTGTKKDGRFKAIIGPDPLDLSEDETPIVPDPRDPTKVAQVDHPGQAICNFITLAPDQYAVLFNPSEAFTDEHPNGGYSSGRNEIKPLKFGAKRVILSGHFPLWPYQKVEVRKVHTLSASQYIMVVVESENVDASSPYYGLTLKCAAIKAAVVEEVQPAEGEAVKASKEEKPSAPEQKLVVGQRIIIPGSLTPTYIPPSGIEVLNDENTRLPVREAVVLGPTEFCVLIDEEGQPNPKNGPGRVFPGPNDRFQESGSRSRVYNAYHVRNDRGLLLRIVAESISVTELKKQLPPGTKLDEKLNYTKGDEVFVGGTDSYLVPSKAFVVVNPETRTPHIGNDHSAVYIQAIGVDQKSGVYIACVETGSVELKRGEVKLLLDPRQEKHVQRRIPARMWNLMIGEGEPHKKAATGDMVTTPWALSIVIPNNEAVLVTSKDSRRCVVGPCTELLGYEEWLEVLTLSRGRPKSDNDQKETCFLRVDGNRVTDTVDLETEDFVRLSVELSYGVKFVGEESEERINWFNYKDYVMLLCANLRSRLKNAAKKWKLTDLYPKVADFIRDTILGVKADIEDHRPGLLFDENNMKVIEVEVLSVRIPDPEVSRMLLTVNSRIVTRKIEDAALAAELVSDKQREDISAEQNELYRRQVLRNQALELQRVEASIAIDGAKEEADFILKTKKSDNTSALRIAAEKLNDVVAEFTRNRQLASEKTDQQIEADANKVVLEFRTALAEIQKALTASMADADVNRLKAIQPGLVEAIEGLGDKQLATSLSEHLPQAAGSLGLLLGQGGITALKEMVKGTPIEEAIDALSDTSANVADSNKNISNPE